MPQAKKKAQSKPKAAAKKPAAVTPQVQRSSMTTETKSSNEDAPPVEQVEETDEDRAAAGNARAAKVSTPGLKGKDPEVVYEPERQELENAGFDHYGAEEKRQAELQAERDRHNELTGDGSRR
jgi:hypothetical protein